MLSPITSCLQVRVPVGQRRSYLIGGALRMK